MRRATCVVILVGTLGVPTTASAFLGFGHARASIRNYVRVTYPRHVGGATRIGAAAVGGCVRLTARVVKCDTEMRFVQDDGGGDHYCHGSYTVRQVHFYAHVTPPRGGPDCSRYPWFQWR